MEADLRLAATVLLNLSMALVLGSSMSSAWLRRGASAWASGQARTLQYVMLAASLTALAATIALLWLEAASMAEVPLAQAAPAVQLVLASTHFGLAWMIGAGALLVLLVALALGNRVPAWAILPIRVVAIGVFLYSRSMVSHAGAMGDLTVAVLADWVHLILISLWVGEVLIAGFVTLRISPGRGAPERLACAGYVQALSDSATVALVGIFITGIVAAWRTVGNIDNAFGNVYSETLWIKLGLVGTAALLGGFNRFAVMPAMLSSLNSAGENSTPGASRFARILQVEAFVLIGAIVMAAILSSTSPPTAG